MAADTRLVFLSAAAVLAVVLSSGCQREEEVDCNTFLDAKLRGECVYNRSMSLLNPAYCKDIPTPALRAKCIDDVSVKLDNDMYCMGHDRLSSQEKCEQKVADARRLRRQAAEGSSSSS